MFGITDSRDFYEKLIEEYEDLHKNPTSARIAVNYAVTAYHMAEGIWGDWLKGDAKAKAALGIKSVDDFKAWVDRETAFFPAMQAITNGTKHFNKRAFNATAKTEGAFYRDGFQADAFSVEHFLIEVVT